MGLFTGKGRAHLAGHKDLTMHGEIAQCPVGDTIAIPLVDGTATDFEVLVKEGDHVKIGSLLAVRKSMYVPLYASVSGVVKGVEKRMHATKRQQNHIIIANDHLDEKIKVIDIKDPDHMTQENIVDAIKQLGIVGMGGSGFPTYKKYEGVKDVDTIIINGVECEPYITSDYHEMMLQTKALFDGAEFFRKAASAKCAIIAIKVGKPELYARLQAMAKSYEHISVTQVPDVYPMGWERLLIETVTKRTYDRLPSEAHVIVDNAASAISLSNGIRSGMPVIERLVTVSGNGIKYPTNIRVRVGTPVHEIIEAIGGYIADGEGYVLAGGPMMGRSITNDQFVISEYMNAITVLKKQEERTFACLKCGECTLHCPMHLQPVRIMQAEKANDSDLLGKLDVMRCVECGMCSYICPSKIEVTDFVAKGKRRYGLTLRRKKA